MTRRGQIPLHGKKYRCPSLKKRQYSPLPTISSEVPDYARSGAGQVDFFLYCNESVLQDVRFKQGIFVKNWGNFDDLRDKIIVQ